MYHFLRDLKDLWSGYYSLYLLLTVKAHLRNGGRPSHQLIKIMIEPLPSPEGCGLDHQHSCELNTPPPLSRGFVDKRIEHGFMFIRRLSTSMNWPQWRTGPNNGELRQFEKFRWSIDRALLLFLNPTRQGLAHKGMSALQAGCHSHPSGCVPRGAVTTC